MIVALAACSYAAAAVHHGVELASEPGFSYFSTQRKVSVRGWQIEASGRLARAWRIAQASPDGFTSNSTATLSVRPPFLPYSTYLDGHRHHDGRTVSVPPGRHTVVFLPQFPTKGVPGELPDGFRFKYDDSYRAWPVEPVHAAHAIRGNFLDARQGGYHFGVDVDVNDKQPDPGAPAGRSHKVFALEGGYVHLRNAEQRIGCINRRIEVGHFAYWHVDPALPEGARVGPGQFIGWTCKGAWHVHVSEWAKLRGRRVWVNPLHLGGKIEPYSNTDLPIVQQVRFMTPPATPWKTWTSPDTATPLSEGRLHGLVDVRARVEILEPERGIVQADRKLPVPDPPYRLGIEIRDVHGHVLLRRVAFESDTLLTTPWQVHFAPPTKPDLSVEMCLKVPKNVTCVPQHWYRPLSRSRLEYWDTRRVPNGRYMIAIVAWDVRDNIGVARIPVVVAN